ncbi:unnamed protein product [Arctia plantaginis]|uniref:alkaline phosphatase n=1 Tax=Arctia plantaginis TaxID=874455 RepID=A0A8S0ZF54_ARCPL|nr:unnamed protein product [Arctia plantaginis]
MNKTTEPTLAELTETAIKILRRNNKGIFLFVEGGRIDHGHHDNRVQFALDETVQLSEAVKRAAGLLSQDDTLIVVTADHAHVMSINGYSNRGHDILGISRNTDTNKAPYMTLSYTNGPGFYNLTGNGVRPDVTKLQNFGK